MPPGSSKAEDVDPTQGLPTSPSPETLASDYADQKNLKDENLAPTEALPTSPPTVKRGEGNLTFELDEDAASVDVTKAAIGANDTNAGTDVHALGGKTLDMSDEASDIQLTKASIGAPDSEASREIEGGMVLDSDGSKSNIEIGTQITNTNVDNQATQLVKLSAADLKGLAESQTAARKLDNEGPETTSAEQRVTASPLPKKKHEKTEKLIGPKKQKINLLSLPQPF